MQRILYLLCVVFIQYIAIGQDYHFKTFNSDNNSPTSLVVNMAEDTLGFLWVGFADKGLFKYDGYNFTLHKDLVVNKGLVELFNNSRGEIIVGSQSQTFKMVGDSLLPYLGINDMVRSYVHLNTGEEFIGTEKGRFILVKNDSIMLDVNKSHYRIGQMSVDSKNNIWFIGGENTISKYSKGKIFDYEFDKDKSEQVWSICVDAEDNVIVSSLNKIKILKQGRFIDWSKKNELLKPYANYIYKDSRNRLWFLHLDGISIYDNGEIQFMRENNFKGIALVTVYEDRKGGFWFGTTKGIMRLQNESCILNPFSLKAEFMLKTIFEDSKGRIWTGSRMDGLVFWDNNKVKKIDLPINGEPEVYNFFEDTDHKIWIATSQGLFIYNDSQITFLEKGVALPNLPVFSVAVSGKKEVWGTTPLGLFELKDKGFDFYPVEEYYNTEEYLGGVFQVYTDKKGVVWVLSDYGLMRVINGKLEKISIGEESFKQIKWGMIEGIGGNYWIATEGNGLICFNLQLNQIKYFGTTEGLLSNSLISIAKDKYGNIITSSVKGINKVMVNNLGEVVNVLSYNKDNGLIDDECLTKVLLSDKDQNIWFGSNAGLIKFKEPSWENISHSIPTYITCSIDSFKMKSNELTYRNNHIQFEVTGINLDNPSAIRYSYLLEGYDKNWSEPSTNRHISFSNLKPGNYNFKVKTLIFDIIDIQGTSNYTFSVNKPLWHKWWFILISIIISIALVGIIMQLWAQSIKNKQIKSEERKRKIIELELKFLRSQMNPHFMFNSINSIQNLILNESVDQALNYLNDFGRLIRRVLNYSEKTTVTIQEELDFLNEYLGLEKLRFKEKISIEINVDPKLDIAFDRIPPMLIQPFVENAIKHGLLPCDKNGKLIIDFSPSDDKLFISIIDNGVGRVYHEKTKQLENHQSKGTKIIEDRISLLKKTTLSEKDYSVEIIDLYDNDKKANGTKVLIEVPLY